MKGNIFLFVCLITFFFGFSNGNEHQVTMEEKFQFTKEGFIMMSKSSLLF